MTQPLTELQEKWLQALESGDYEQCRGELHDGSGYCCLGVGATLLGILPVKRGDRFFFGTEDAKAPEMLIEGLGLRGDLGDFTQGMTLYIGESAIDERGTPCQSLAELNDAGETFSQIAARIRANPENFFLPSTTPEAGL